MVKIEHNRHATSMETRFSNIEKPKDKKWTTAVIMGGYVSKSPVAHNAAYKDLGIANDWEFIQLTTPPEELEGRIKTMRDAENFFAGAAIGAPHKLHVMPLIDSVSDTAKIIGAVNTVVVERSGSKTHLLGTNTDFEGFVGAVAENGVDIKGKTIGIVGAEGAARATIFGAQREGAERIKVFSRREEPRRLLEKQFGVEIGDSRTELGELANFDIIVNATDIGMKGEAPVIPVDNIQRGQVVVEWDYSGDLDQTRLEEEAASEKVGATVVRARLILLHQMKTQFQLFTGVEAPMDVMRAVIFSKAA